MESSYYTIDQVARLLEMHHKTIRKFISDGRLPARKVGKQWRISGHDLSVFVEKDQQTVTGAKAGAGKGPEAGGDNGPAAVVKGGVIAGQEDDREAAGGVTRAVAVSAVIDINNVNPEGYSRISSMITAVMNSNDPGLRGSAVNVKYFKDELKARIMLWGGINYIIGALESVSVIAGQDNTGSP